MDRVIDKALWVGGVLNAPASKSYAQRALLGNFLSGFKGSVINVGNSNDARALKTALEELGRGACEVDINESGLACRLVCPCVGILGRDVVVRGEGSILKRSMRDMVDDLIGMGLRVVHNDGKLPIEISGRYDKERVVISGSGGSQFLSGLLFALPLCDHDTVLEVKDLKSKPYVDMTLEVLERFGIVVENDNYERFLIKGGQKFCECNYVVEGDWSSVGAMLVAGAVGGSLVIGGLNRDSLQADAAILKVLESVGARVEWSGDVVKVSKESLKSFQFDATDCPDLFCALVSLAVACDGETVIKGVERLRNKESDRAETLRSEFRKMGAEVEFEGDYMKIRGGSLIGAVVDSHNDHRIAMATAVAALRAEGKTTIVGSECVSKSYADFFEDLSKIVHYE